MSHVKTGQHSTSIQTTLSWIAIVYHINHSLSPIANHIQSLQVDYKKSACH
ncbi:MAG: hypothetical protein WCJ61_02280 [Paludibacter sp.]